MKTDAYTKSVLTVIACCLLYFVAKDISVIPDAHANAVVDINIVKVAGSTISLYEGVPVKLK
jgi:hypothetical protein